VSLLPDPDAPPAARHARHIQLSVSRPGSDVVFNRVSCVYDGDSSCIRREAEIGAKEELIFLFI